MTNGDAHFIVINQDEIIQALPDDLLGHHKGFTGGETAGKGVNGRRAAVARLPGEIGGRGAGGLDGDHFDLVAHRFSGQTSARRTAAPAQWDEKEVNIGLFFENFERMGANAGNQQWFIAGIDKVHAGFPFQGDAMAFARFKIGTMKDNLGAIAAHRFDLDRVGLFRHDNYRPHAKLLGGISNRLAVVAG